MVSFLEIQASGMGALVLGVAFGFVSGALCGALLLVLQRRA